MGKGKGLRVSVVSRAPGADFFLTDQGERQAEQGRRQAAPPTVPRRPLEGKGAIGYLLPGKIRSPGGLRIHPRGASGQAL